MVEEIVLQGGLVLLQLAVPPLPGHAPQAREAAFLELVQVALHTAAGNAGEAGDIRMGEALTLEPQNLHFLLDAGMGVVMRGVRGGCVILLF